MSVKGLNVKIVGNNKTYTATQIDNVPTIVTDPLNGGAFYPFTTVYKIDTKGTNALKEGAKYTLNINDPNDQGLSFSAYTIIPAIPKINAPAYVAGQGTTKAIKKENLQAPYVIKWVSRSKSDVLTFELRSFLYYEKNGKPDTLVYESALLTNGQGVGCTATSTEMCYLFNGRELLQYFKSKMPETESVNGSQVTNSYTYINTPDEAPSIDDLPQKCAI